MFSNGLMMLEKGGNVYLYVKAGPLLECLGYWRPDKQAELELPMMVAKDLLDIARERQQAELEKQRQEQIENSRDSNDR